MISTFSTIRPVTVTRYTTNNPGNQGRQYGSTNTTTPTTNTTTFTTNTSTFTGSYHSSMNLSGNDTGFRDIPSYTNLKNNRESVRIRFSLLNAQALVTKFTNKLHD